MLRTKVRTDMRLFVALLLLFFSAIPCFAAEPPAMPPARVVVSHVEVRQTAATSDMIGLLYFERVSELSGEVAGLAADVNVTEGDLVQKGQPLLVIDTVLLDKEIELHKAILAQIVVKMERVKKDIGRFEKLIQRQATSEKALDDLLFDYRALENEKIAQIARVEKLQLQKEKSVVCSPFNGIILKKNVDAGSWVEPGFPVLTVGSISDVFVKVSVSENILQFLHKESILPVRINALNRNVDGIFTGIKPLADAKTKNIILKVRLPELTGIAENMSATVSVPMSQQQQLKIIPRDALIKYQGKDFIYTIKDDKAAIMPVHIVAYLGRDVGVDDAHINAGMIIVVDGNDRLRPDQSVQVVEK